MLYRGMTNISSDQGNSLNKKPRIQTKWSKKLLFELTKFGQWNLNGKVIKI